MKTQTAFAQSAVICQNETVEGIPFDFGVTVSIDKSFDGTSGPSFNVCFSYVTQGAVKDGKSYDVVMLTVPRSTAQDADILISDPLKVSKAGRRVYLTLSSGKADTLELLDEANTTSDLKQET